MALSYLDTVLALLPVAFWRLDEVGGTVMSDSSGNAHNGTFFNDCVFGRPSPILTDAGSSAIGGRVGQAPALDSSPLDASTGSTIGGWILYRNDFLAGTATLMAREAQWGVLGGFVELVAPETPVHNTWYFLAGVRNGAVVRLYVNAALAWEETVNVSDEYPRHILGINNDSFEYALRQRNTADPPWMIGVSGSGNVWAAGGVDEPFVFDYALSEAQLLAIYEAGIGATFLHGRADANPTGVLRSTFEPDPISFPFRHNWTETLTERISFSSAISQAVAGDEESVSEIEAPRREFEWTQLLRDNRERRKLRALLWANQHAKWFIPIRQYAEQLQVGLSTGATTTPISITYKDYEIDSWIGFRQLSATGEIEHWEERLITSLTPLTHEPLVNNYAAFRSLVYPVRRALLRAQQSITGHTDAVEELTITARLMPEDEHVIPNRIVPFSPTIKYRDVEVFDGRIWQSNDWSENREYEVERSGSEVDFRTGLIGFDSDTAGASETFSYRMVIEGIDRIARFLGWYYERVGALNYLWVPTMQEDFELLSVVDDEITVRDTNYSDAFALAEPRRDLAFVYWNGTVVLRRVVAFALAGANEVLTLDADAPTTTSLRFISLLKYCRLDADQLELAWQTDNKIQVAWRFREPLMTPEGVGVSSLSPSASLSGSVSPSGSASPSTSTSPSLSSSLSVSPSSSISPSSSTSPSHSSSHSPSPSASVSPSHSASPST
jgi:hypothetical protein